MTFLPTQIPLIQAPMASAQGAELAIAVCRAGGLGSLPAAMLTPERLREQIEQVVRSGAAHDALGIEPERFADRFAQLMKP